MEARANRAAAVTYYKNMTFMELRRSVRLVEEHREDLRLIGGGIGIHWPQLDEDLSIRGLLFPHPEDAQRVG